MYVCMYVYARSFFPSIQLSMVWGFLAFVGLSIDVGSKDFALGERHNRGCYQILLGGGARGIDTPV